MNHKVLFLFGFFIGTSLSLFLIFVTRDFIKEFKSQSPTVHEAAVKAPKSLSEKLFDEVKVLCWVMTNPKNHQTKAEHVRRTWGKRCNKILFMSSKTDVELGTVAMPATDTYNGLWGKTKNAFHFIYYNHFDDADWFVKVDDDSYLVLENLRFMLHQYQPETSLYFGHRYSVEDNEDGYMAGGGYILSKAALKKFVTRILPNKTLCRNDNEGAEDLEMGKCLEHYAIAVDERDELMQKRFFPLDFTEHLRTELDQNYWFDRNQYYEAHIGSLNCCSDKPIMFHYIVPQEMYLLDYLIYQNPFGLQINLQEKLPRKLKFEEIVKASDTESSSLNFRKHEPKHYVDDSEIF